MQHVMLDLETFGTKPGCALRSVGAVSFDLDGAIWPDSFYQNIDRSSCAEVGLKEEISTLEWWDKQSPEAQAALLVNPRLLRAVVDEFHAWFRAQGAEYVWSHGGNFDEPIWCAAAAACGFRVPWKFWNARCTRTAYHLANFDPRSIQRVGTYHNALDDAKYQTQCVQEAFRRLRGRAVTDDSLNPHSAEPVPAKAGMTQT
jgi:hypothetical protein